MKFKKPKNIVPSRFGLPRGKAGETDKIAWTKHSIEKMRFYNLSENRLKRVLRNPQRKEEGIAPGTLAVMQRTGSRKRPTEIWIMYQIINSKLKSQNSKLRIISAWRYPGISPVGKEIPIPEDILRELKNII